MGKDKTGVSLEIAVARIQQMMDPGSVVTHNEIITDRLGNPRQFDVVVRGTFAGNNMLGVLECKDWADKVGTPEMDAFITKSRNIHANLAQMVSQKGFTAPAVKQAKDAGIGTLSLMTDDSGPSLGIEWFGLLYQWENFKVHMTWTNAVPTSYNARHILFRGKPLINWYLRELSTTYGTITDLGQKHLTTVFETPVTVEVDGREYELSAFGVEAERTCRKKNKMLQINGEGYYDWQACALKIAPQGKTTIGPMSVELSDWDDFDGELPSPVTPPQGIINSYPHCIDIETKEIVDMSGY